MKTEQMKKECEAAGFALVRNQYIIRSRTRRGWKGRPVPCLDVGYRWHIYEMKTGRGVVSRPTPAAAFKFWREWQAKQPEAQSARREAA